MGAAKNFPKESGERGDHRLLAILHDTGECSPTDHKHSAVYCSVVKQTSFRNWQHVPAQRTGRNHVSYVDFFYKPIALIKPSEIHDVNNQ